MAAAAALLVADDATASEIEEALAAVIHDDAIGEFSRSFGPRRLMKRLARGDLSDAAMELADVLLSSAADAPISGLTALAFDELHHDELHPDILLPLGPCTPPGPVAAAAGSEDWWLHLPLAADCGRAAVVPSSNCQLRFEPEDDATSTVAAHAPTLRLAQLSRRAMIGSEIECKIWPAAGILSRWLWQHRRLVQGQTVLELGAGVGTAGLAAAASGARRVVLTDINSAALRCARENCTRNGDVVREATTVAHLDWARPPVLEAADAALSRENASASAQSDGDAEKLLHQPFDLVLAADVVNDVGLSELVFRMLQLYLSPRGLFVMCCPKPVHRHCVERLQSMLRQAPELSVHVADAPAWATDVLDDEATVVQHELWTVQWVDGRRGAPGDVDHHVHDGSAGGPALTLEAPAKL